MKLLVQASDFGFTRASVYGVIDSIELRQRFACAVGNLESNTFS